MSGLIKLSGAQPITGEDLVKFKKEMGWATLDINWHFAIYTTNWIKMTKTTPDRKKGQTVAPIKQPISPTRALMLRLLNQLPSECLLPTQATPAEVLDLIRSVPKFSDFPVRYFGPLFGCEVGSGYRWSKGKGTSPVRDRYMTIVRNVMQKMTIEQRAEFVEMLISNAELEAKARGLSMEDLWNKGDWQSGTPQGRARKKAKIARRKGLRSKKKPESARKAA